MPSSTDHQAPVNVREIMHELRLRVRAGNQQRESADREVRRLIPNALHASMARLRITSANLYEASGRIGEVPPSPPTLRAQIGSLAIRLMQRSLFWLIPTMRTTQQQLAQAVREHVGATEQMLKILQETNIQLEMLRRSVEASQGIETSRDPMVGR
jgi:hypothetical protein